MYERKICFCCKLDWIFNLVWISVEYVQCMEFTRPAVEVWSWTFPQQTEGGAGINYWAKYVQHVEKEHENVPESASFPSESKKKNKSLNNEVFSCLASVFSSALVDSLGGVKGWQRCHQHFPGSELAWAVMKEDQAKLLHTAAKPSEFASWLPNLREKVNIKLTVEILKDIRGDMLAMSSALGSGGKKNQNKVSSNLQINLFLFFCCSQKKTYGPRCRLEYFVCISSLYFDPIFMVSSLDLPNTKWRLHCFPGTRGKINIIYGLL